MFAGRIVPVSAGALAPLSVTAMRTPTRSERTCMSGSMSEIRPSAAGGPPHATTVSCAPTSASPPAGFFAPTAEVTEHAGSVKKAVPSGYQKTEFGFCAEG